MKCYVVKDLLSNYIDGLCSEETNEGIKKHLDVCNDCRAVYEKMSTAIPEEILPEDNNIDFRKKMKTRMRRRNALAALSACIVLLAGFYVFANNYEIPIPFDENHMSVEVFKAAVVTDEDGTISLKEIDPRLMDEIVPEHSGNVVDAVRLAYEEINRISKISRGRTINRNGENIRVVYYCYTRSLWDSLVFDDGFAGQYESGRSFGSDIYGENYESADYEPQMREIYYLPVRNLHKIGELSDEEFDGLREKGSLIWSGVI